MTNVFSGVSGITALSPALSVAQKAPRAVFSVYSHGGYAIQSIDDLNATPGTAITQLPPSAAVLPPLERETGVVALLSDPEQGLPDENSMPVETAVRSYHPRLSLDFIAQPSLAVAADRFGTYIGGGVTLYWSDMLGDHNLVTMAQVNGRIGDWAALVGYQNRKRRLNWSIGAQVIPYIEPLFTNGFDDNGNYFELIRRYKQTSREVSGVVAYPFNRSLRFEASVGVQQITYNDEIQVTGYDPGSGQVVYDSTFHNPVPPALGLGTATFAFVRDNTFFGAVGPILGDRWRIEADPTYGTLNFVTALVDYRKYVMPFRPFTIAGRFLHIGRYGKDGDDSRFYQMFIGYPSLVRGYDYGSFNTLNEPVYDHLFGSRIMVASMELRFPLFGVLGLGGGYYGVLPVEAGLFYDAGVAWTGTEGVQVFGTGPRQVIHSAGASFRMNLFGFAIGQMDVVHPFQRPQKDWMVRFSLTPAF
jgi:hypothetical protein